MKLLKALYIKWDNHQYRNIKKRNQYKKNHGKTETTNNANKLRETKTYNKNITKHFPDENSISPHLNFRNQKKKSLKLKKALTYNVE